MFIFSIKSTDDKNSKSIIQKILSHYQWKVKRDEVKKKNKLVVCSFFGGKWWIRTTEDEVDGFTVRCIWPLCKLPIKNGAGGRNRTNNRLITSQMLYHWATPAYLNFCFCKDLIKILSCISFKKKWCLRAESNRRHRDFQSLALPTELPRHINWISSI